METFLFILLVVMGTIILYPLTPKFFPEHKKTGLAIGIVVIHLGAYGLLWGSVSSYLIISFILIEAGFFALWDPLRLCPPNQREKARSAGVLFMVGGILCGISTLTHFPPWLWIIPALLYLAPQVLSIFRAYQRLLATMAIIIIAAYLAIMGFSIYRSTYRSADNGKINAQKTEVKPAPNATEQSLTASVTPQQVPDVQTPAAPTGPIASAIQDIDEKIRALEEEKRKLALKTEALQAENKTLKENLDEKTLKIEEQTKTIEELKKLVNQL